MEAYPHVVPGNSSVTNPPGPWETFDNLAAEDPALVLRVLGIHRLTLGEDTKAPNPERTAMAQVAVSRLVDTLMSNDPLDGRQFEGYRLYQDQLFNLRMAKLATNERPEDIAAARKRLIEIKLGILTYRTALGLPSIGNRETGPTLPKQRTPAEAAHLSAA